MQNKNRKTTKKAPSPKLALKVDYYESFNNNTTQSNQNKNIHHRTSKSQPPKRKSKSIAIKKSKPKKIKKNTKKHKRHKLSTSKPSPPLPPPHLLHTPARSFDENDKYKPKKTNKTRLRPQSTSHRNSQPSKQKTRFSLRSSSLRSRSMTPSPSLPQSPKHFPNTHMINQQNAPNINLNMRIDQAKGLKKNHTYCISVSIGSNCYTTQEIESPHPKWNETFLFSFEYANYIIITLNEIENTEKKIDLFDDDDDKITNESTIMIHFRSIGKYSKLTWLSLNKLEAKLCIKIKLHSSSTLDLVKYKTEMNNMLTLCRDNNLNLIINDIKIKSNQRKSLKQSTTASASLTHPKLYQQSKIRCIEYPVGSEKLLIILENVNIIVNRGIVEVCDVVLTSYRLIIRYHAIESQALSFQILFGLIVKLKIKQKRVNNKIINPLTGAICETFETRKSEKKLGYKMKYFMHKINITMDGDDIAENIFFRDVLTIRTKTGKCIEIASKHGYRRKIMHKSFDLCCNPNKQSIAIYEMSMKILNTFNKHNILFPISTNFRHMSSYNWCNYLCNDKIFNPLNTNDWIYEFETRQQVPSNKFRKTKINYKYELCPTYPQIFYVPYGVSDELCVAAAKFRSRNRMVILDYYNAVNGNIIARCAQPMRGIMNKSNEYDIKYMNAIRKTVGKNGKLIFFDCRSEAAAQANRFRGKGTEKQEWYGNTKIIFLDIPNIHVMRNSFDELCNIISKYHGHDVGHLIRKICKSNNKWNKYIFSLIVGGLLISKRVLDNDKNIVSIIHCSDGWDRTSQLCALTQILIDPYCRTINGFIMIIEKEWLSFGHKFKDRNGFIDKKDERSPIFLQFIECIYNLVNIFANEFEFNIYFLIKIAKYYQTYWFGNFLFNSQRERKENNIHKLCVNIWSWKNLIEEINPDYNPKCKFLYITKNQLQNKIKPLFFEYFNLKPVQIQKNNISKKKLLNGMNSYSNSSNNSCNDCNKQFSLFKKRLECDRCKKIFCNKCVQKMESDHDKDDYKENDIKLYQCYDCVDRRDRVLTI